MMNFEAYYNNLFVRLFALVILSSIVSGFYLKYLKDSDEHSFLKQKKTIYSIQIMFWILFLSNLFSIILPTNIFGFFAFELIILTIIFISFTFLLWELFSKKRFAFGLFVFSLPFIMLFLFALGMN